MDNVVTRLRLRMAGMKCVALHSDRDRVLVDAAIQEAQQQGAKVSQNHLFWLIFWFSGFSFLIFEIKQTILLYVVLAC